MKIGLFTDGLMHLPFDEALAKAASLGVQTVEIGTGNFSPASHCDLNGCSAVRKLVMNFSRRLIRTISSLPRSIAAAIRFIRTTTWRSRPPA